MSDLSSFDAFVVRIRSGDEAAARELVERFGSVIRREVRLRLYDRHLLRMFDSMDILQSVLVSFFSRAEAGQFLLETPEQLARLLIGMARNKLEFQRRKEYARRRDSRLTEATPIDEIDLAASSPGPSQIVSERDLISTVTSRMSEEERCLLNLRAEGCEWSEIADQLGGSAQARRMQLARAVQRISNSLASIDHHA